MNEFSEKIILNLSVGELAFALGVQQSEDVAFEIIQNQFSALDEDDAETVIVASGHSLLARDFVREDSEGNYKLSPTLEKNVRLLAEANLTILCNYSIGDETTYITFHFSPGGIIRHSIKNDVVHEMEILPNINNVLDATADFYSIPKHSNQHTPSIYLRQSLFDEILFSRDRTFIEERLRQARVLESVRVALTDDLLNHKLRGSIVRVEHHKDRVTKSEHRIFLLGGVSRLWLLQPYLSGGEWFFDVSLGMRTNFGEKVRSIINEMIAVETDKAIP